MKTAPLVALALALLVPATAAARDLPSETPDLTADTDGDVTGVVTNGSRTVLWGDDFRLIGRPHRGDALLSPTSGTLRAAFADGGETLAAIPDGAGGWYTGGAGQVRRLRADGSLDPAFNVTLAAGERVEAVALAGSTLWLAGFFERVNGEVRGGVAAVDATTGALRPWRADTRFENDDLVVVGDQVVVAGSRGIVALDALTGAVRASAAGVTIGRALALYDGTLYASTAYAGMLALDPVTLATRWGVRYDVGSGDIAAGPQGVFVSSPSGVAKIDPATRALAAGWRVPIARSGAIALSPDGEIAYVGRAWVEGWPLRGALAFATRDGALLGWAPRTMDWATPEAVAVAPDGASVFVEASPLLDAHERPLGAVLDETGAVTPAIPPSAGNLALDARNVVYSPQGAHALDGTLRWPLTFSGGSGAPALSADEQTVYLGGTFTAVNGVARTDLAAVRAADGAVLSWAPRVTGGHVNAVVTAGSTVYVAGSFTAIGGVPRAGLAALDASGAVLPFAPVLEDPVWRLRTGPGMLYALGGGAVRGFRTSDGALVFELGDVRDVAPLADGQTVMVATDGRRPLTAWDVAGGERLAWHPDECVDCTVNALALEPDGRTLHVGGRWHGRHYARLAIARPPSAPANALAPQVVGEPRPGAFVACDPGRWTGHPAAYRFAWSLDGVPVAGFDGRDLLLEPADMGRSVRCTVGAGAATATSPPVTVLSVAPVFHARRVAFPVTGPPPAVALPPPVPVPPAGGRFGAFFGRPSALPDTAAADVVVRKAKRGRVRLFVSERVRLTTTLKRGRKVVRRAFTLPGGRHVLTPRRLSGRAKLRRGRYTLTVRARDMAGNVSRARVLRFTV